MSGTQLGGKEREASPGFDRGSIRIFGLDGSVVYSPVGNGRGVYGMFGAGGYALRRLERDLEPDVHNVPGFSFGVGTNLRIGATPAFVQARMEVPFSTLGTNSEFAPTTFIPIVFGIRFP